MSFESEHPCVVCGISGEGLVTGHHLYSRKAFPEFARFHWNMIPVCQLHHNMFHSAGNITMAQNYKSVSDWLELNRWEIFNGKLIHKD